MAWGLQSDRGSTVYSRSAVNFINTWFLNPDTKMNPNLDYAQIIRGPHQWQGSQYGLIDLKCFPKIASAILILREGKAPDWTPDIDTGMASWAKQYINWLQTSAQGINESRSKNNHGTFYENQLAALKLISGDVTGANQNARAYFSNQYLNQISADGKQPLELARTRPYHYSAFNIAGMITNGRIAAYTGNSSVWDLPSLSGATIKTAVDYAITMNASATNETSAIDELTPYIAAVASIYGDPNGKYKSQLDTMQSGWQSEAWVVWNQPLKMDLSSPSSSSSSSLATGTNSSSTSSSEKSMGVNLLLALMGLLMGCFLQ